MYSSIIQVSILFNMKSRLTFVILLLLVFISQETVTFAKTCQMKTETSSPMKMEHMQTKDNSSGTETNIIPDCCANAAVGNHCSMSGCLLLALPNFIFNQTVFMASETVEHSDSISLSSIPGSLYRPPILA